MKSKIFITILIASGIIGAAVGATYIRLDKATTAGGTGCYGGGHNWQWWDDYYRYTDFGTCRGRNSTGSTYTIQTTFSDCLQQTNGGSELIDYKSSDGCWYNWGPWHGAGGGGGGLKPK